MLLCLKFAFYIKFIIWNVHNMQIKYIQKNTSKCTFGEYIFETRSADFDDSVEKIGLDDALKTHCRCFFNAIKELNMDILRKEK